MKAHLHIVRLLAEQLKDAIADYDRCKLELAIADANVIALGQRYIAEKYPDAREPMRPSLERVRREVASCA